MDQIEEVRSKIDIVQVISEYITLQKAGSNFKAVCPFHAEKTPSLIVSPERQIFKCFGCGKGGSVFNFLMEMEGMDFGEALKVLAKRAGVTLLSYRPNAHESERERLYQINHLASEFYHFLLLSHPSGKKALDYLLGRGINKESMEVFKLGYAPPLWDGLIKFLIDKRGYKTEELLKLGLILRSQNGFRDFFRDRLVFPLRDHRGNTVGFTGRVLGTWESKLGPKYLNTHETELYHKGDLLYGLESTKQAIKSENQAIAVEGQMDLISSYQAGVQNVIAVSGSALTESQSRLLKRFCETLVLAFDVDLAGDQAARRGIKTAENSGFTLKIAQVPQGKDPDDLIRQNPKEWKRVVNEAIGVYDFLLDSSFARFKEQGAEGKKKIGQEVIPVLSQINDEIVKDHYIRKLAQKLQVGEDSIHKQMEKTEGGKTISIKEVEKVS
ncbi:MAG: DNA primase, partial [Candidatus Curtissbacteria bacterium]|nr:DNA primase [Candidatus Curtissbacteria bacterium]